MSETPEPLNPDLEPLYNHIKESGDKGIRLDELMDKLNKDKHDSEIVLAIVDDLSTLWTLGYIHKIIIETRFERGIEWEERWFVVGKGESKRGKPLTAPPF